jgi:hypothetical protein
VRWGVMEFDVVRSNVYHAEVEGICLPDPMSRISEGSAWEFLAWRS